MPNDFTANSQLTRFVYDNRDSTAPIGGASGTAAGFLETGITKKPGKASGESRMSPQDGSTRDSDQSYVERWAAEPFLSKVTEDRAPGVHPWYQAYTPFKEEQELEERYGQQAEEEDFYAELEDEETDEEAYEEPLDQASELELYQEPPAGKDEYQVTQSAGTERPLQEHFESLVEEAKWLLDEMASDLRQYDLADVSEAEIEAFLNQYQPIGIHLADGFEYSLDDVRDMAKRLFKGTVTLTKLQTRQPRLQPINTLFLGNQAFGIPILGNAVGVK